MLLLIFGSSSFRYLTESAVQDAFLTFKIMMQSLCVVSLTQEAERPSRGEV